MITTRGKRKFRPVPSSVVCLIYELLHSRGLVSFPITDEAKAKAETLVINIIGTNWGKKNYDPNEQRAVAYLYFIIKDHPFTDGNKRTASLVFSVVCEINDLKPDYTEFTLDEVAVFIEKIQEADYQRVIRTLSRMLFGD